MSIDRKRIEAVIDEGDLKKLQAETEELILLLAQDGVPQADRFEALGMLIFCRFRQQQIYDVKQWQKQPGSVLITDVAELLSQLTFKAEDMSGEAIAHFDSIKIQSTSVAILYKTASVSQVIQAKPVIDLVARIDNEDLLEFLELKLDEGGLSARKEWASYLLSHLRIIELLSNHHRDIRFQQKYAFLNKIKLLIPDELDAFLREQPAANEYFQFQHQLEQAGTSEEFDKVFADAAEANKPVIITAEVRRKLSSQVMFAEFLPSHVMENPENFVDWFEHDDTELLDGTFMRGWARDNFISIVRAADSFWCAKLPELPSELIDAICGEISQFGPTTVDKTEKLAVACEFAKNILRNPKVFYTGNWEYAVRILKKCEAKGSEDAGSFLVSFYSRQGVSTPDINEYHWGRFQHGSQLVEALKATDGKCATILFDSNVRLLYGQTGVKACEVLVEMAPLVALNGAVDAARKKVATPLDFFDLLFERFYRYLGRAKPEHNKVSARINFLTKEQAEYKDLEAHILHCRSLRILAPGMLCTLTSIYPDNCKDILTTSEFLGMGPRDQQLVIDYMSRHYPAHLLATVCKMRAAGKPLVIAVDIQALTERCLANASFFQIMMASIHILEFAKFPPEVSEALSSHQKFVEKFKGGIPEIIVLRDQVDAVIRFCEVDALAAQLCVLRYLTNVKLKRGVDPDKLNRVIVGLLSPESPLYIQDDRMRARVIAAVKKISEELNNKELLVTQAMLDGVLPEDAVPDFYSRRQIALQREQESLEHQLQMVIPGSDVEADLQFKLDIIDFQLAGIDVLVTETHRRAKTAEFYIEEPIGDETPGDGGGLELVTMPASLSALNPTREDSSGAHSTNPGSAPVTPPAAEVCTDSDVTLAKQGNLRALFFIISKLTQPLGHNMPRTSPLRPVRVGARSNQTLECPRPILYKLLCLDFSLQSSQWLGLHQELKNIKTTNSLFALAKLRIALHCHGLGEVAQADVSEGIKDLVNTFDSDEQSPSSFYCTEWLRLVKASNEELLSQYFQEGEQAPQFDDDFDVFILEVSRRVSPQPPAVQQEPGSGNQDYAQSTAPYEPPPAVPSAVGQFTPSFTQRSSPTGAPGVAAENPGRGRRRLAFEATEMMPMDTNPQGGGSDDAAEFKGPGPAIAAC